jgi:hypothetical protein
MFVSVAKCPVGIDMDHVCSGSFLMNEDALVRLEAGLRAQRERLSKEPPQPSAGLEPAGVPDTLQPVRACGPIEIPNFLKQFVEESSP